MDILPTCMCVHHVHAWCLGRPEEGVISPRTKVTDGFELTYVLGMEPRSFAKAANAFLFCFVFKATARLHVQ